MTHPKTLLTTLMAVIVVTVNPAFSQEADPTPPDRPVLNAFVEASPRQRLLALRMVEQQRTTLGPQIRADLSEIYPNFSESLVRAALNTIDEHPGQALVLWESTRARFGPRLDNLRRAVREDLEATYPDFQNRLDRALSSHLTPPFLSIIQESHSAHLGEPSSDLLFSQSPSVKTLRERLTLARTRGISQKEGQQILARRSRLIELFRQRLDAQPELASRLLERRTAQRRAALESLQREFPGAAEIVLLAVERTDPGLGTEVGRHLLAESAGLRGRLWVHLEQELPGLEAALRTVVEKRAGDLRVHLMRILNG